MKERWRAWLEETHGTRFELLRHFLARFFDSELVATPGEWARVAAGLAAIVCCSWTLLARVLMFKYDYLREAGKLSLVPGEAVNDRVTLMALAMCLTAVFTALLWQSLYPTLRDYLALASLPLRPGEIFVAKLGALGIAFTAFALFLTVPTSIVFRAATGQGAFVDLFSACALVFFVLLAWQGLMLNLLPANWFERASIWAQALLATAAVAMFPLLSWIAPALVSARIGEFTRVALPVAFAAAMMSYLLSYHRYRKLMLEAAIPRAHDRRRDWFGWAVEFAIEDPREQAAFGFFWKTIARSRTHRLALLAYLGLGVAWTLKSVTGMLNEDPASNVHRFVAASGPLTIALFLLFGLRYLFALPTELRANWMFRITEREGRLAWLTAVERLVLGVVMPPVLLLGAVMVTRAEGLPTAIGWSILAFVFVSVVFERVFRDWRKLPFTCAYLPGKRPMIYTLVAYLWIVPALFPVAFILYYAAGNPASFLVVLALEGAIWWRFRRLRMTRWGLSPLDYEERELVEVETYGLSDEGTTVAQEQFQRQWSDYLRYGVDVPIVRPMEEGETARSRAAEWARAVPQDLRFALRMLAKSPAFALTAIGTLALGLGLNTAVFTVFNTLVLKPATVLDPHSLVSLNFRTHEDERAAGLSRAQINELSAIKEFSTVLAFTPFVTGLDGRAAKGSFVTGNYFESLGVRMALGRPIEIHDREPVVVLDYRAWVSRFAADRGVVGRTVRLNNQPFTVIGVAAEEYRGIEKLGVDFWAPLDVWNGLPGVMNLGPEVVVGRLRPPASEYTARMAATAIARRATEDRERHLRIRAVRLDSVSVPVPLAAFQYFMPFLLVLAITMAIPCFNTANMMLARAMVRQREIAVRLSLGASRGRVVRQMLTEGLVIAVLGGVAGLAVARGSIELSLRMLYATAPGAIFFHVRLPDLEIDAHVFLYMLGAAVATTVAFALAPAAQATKPESMQSRQTGRMRDALVVGQVALCAGLLISAAIALRGSGRLSNVDVGYRPEGVYAIAWENPNTLTRLAGVLERAPWVESLAFARHPVPHMPSMRINSRDVLINLVSNNYFHTLRIPLVRGRDFTRQEAESGAALTIVSESAAKSWWPGQDPIGQTVTLAPALKRFAWMPAYREARVIGVSKDIVSRTLLDAGRPTAHFPGLRLEAGFWALPFIRGRETGAETVRRLESILAETNQAEFGARILHLREAVEWDTYPQRAASWLSSLMAAVSLLLTITGMYGVMSYLVSQRTKEVGIRMAIGASRGQVAGFVLSYSARLMAVGLGLGVFLALGTAKYFASSLGTVVDVYDVAAYAFGLSIVAIATMLAAAGPTHRATRVDPVTALRAD
jgi:macrolide transport system ATP-binding/permease protein